MQHILAIETSCDETAVAIVRADKKILAHKVLSQTVHLEYGGVVPELAARAHVEFLDQLVEESLAEAGLTLADMDAFAATSGPGLIGGLLVGVMTAKMFASIYRKPFLAINHLEGHALTIRLVEEVAFPFLLLLVSGGHCQILVVEGLGHYKCLGETMDDALGEAFDKVGKMLGFAYPAGPIVEQHALQGDPNRFPLPRSLVGRPGCDFSFSGLKAAARRVIESLGEPSAQDIADLCASFQQTVAAILVDRLQNALTQVAGLSTLVVAGGVAANQYIRQHLQALASEHNMHFTAPPIALCTDNAAMIGWVAMERLLKGESDSLQTEPTPRWPLAQLSNDRL